MFAKIFSRLRHPRPPCHSCESRNLSAIQTTLRFLRPRLKIIIPIVLILAIAIPCLVYAADPADVAAEPYDFDKVLMDMIQGWSVFITWMYKIVWLVLAMIGALLDSSGLMALKAGAEPDSLSIIDALRDVWRIFRDFVNIGFVLVLLGIAIYNVIAPPGEGSFQLKTILPKFVIAIIAVNFSFQLCLVVVDASNVLTFAVAAIPDAVGKMPALDATAACPDEATVEQYPAICTGVGQLSDDLTYLQDLKDAGSMPAVLAFNFLKLHALKVVASTEDPKPLDITVSMLSDLVIFAVIMLSLVAMLIVLVVRIVIIWIILAVSPFLFFFWVLPDYAKKLQEFDIQEKFIQHVFAPVIMVAALSIGIIMLSAISDFKTTDPLDSPRYNVRLEKLNYKDDAIQTLADFLIQAMGIIIIWVGVFGAASKTGASFLTDGIKNFGQNAGKWIAKSPAYATVVPGKGGGSLMDFKYKADKAFRARDEKARAGANPQYEHVRNFVDAGNDIKKMEEHLPSAMGVDRSSPTYRQQLKNYITHSQNTKSPHIKKRMEELDIAPDNYDKWTDNEVMQIENIIKPYVGKPGGGVGETGKADKAAFAAAATTPELIALASDNIDTVQKLNTGEVHADQTQNLSYIQTIRTNMKEAKDSQTQDLLQTLQSLEPDDQTTALKDIAEAASQSKGKFSENEGIVIIEKYKGNAPIPSASVEPIPESTPQVTPAATAPTTDAPADSGSPPAGSASPPPATSP